MVVTERSHTHAKLVRGARIGIMGKPCAEFVVGMWGAWLSGAVAVPLALNHPEAELLHVLSDAVSYQFIICVPHDFSGQIQIVFLHKQVVVLLLVFIPLTFCKWSLIQGVSIVFATEEYRELLEPAAKKCDARFYVLPSVTGSVDEHELEQSEAQVLKVASSMRGIVVTEPTCLLTIL